MKRQVYANENRDRTITRLAPLVRKVALGIARRLPASITVDDLSSAGAIGLIHAVDSYDARHGSSIESYARVRIRGSILDALRRDDIVPRRMRAQLSKILRARRKLEAERDDVSNAEVAAEAGVREELVESLEETVLGSGVVHIDSFDTFADQASNVEALVSGREDQQRLREALTQLADKDRQVLLRYYFQEQTYKEIGAEMGLTESRICQLHRQAVKRLGKMLRKNDPDGTKNINKNNSFNKNKQIPATGTKTASSRLQPIPQVALCPARSDFGLGPRQSWGGVSKETPVEKTKCYIQRCGFAK